jgi:CHAT domain-containing protein
MTTRCLRLPQCLCWLCIGLLLSLLSAMVPRHLPPALTLGVALASDPPAVATAADRSEGYFASADTAIQTTFDQGQQAYDQQDYEGAIALWRSLLPHTSPLQQAVILSNISLAHQALRQWEPAEYSIRESLTGLGWPDATDPQQAVPLASALDVYGQWLYFQGDAETALQRWAEAEQLYPQNDASLLVAMVPWERSSTIAHNQLNQAQALQYLGRHLDAQALLSNLYDWVQTPPADLAIDTQVDILLNFGQILRLVGNLEDGTPNALDVLKEAEMRVEAGPRLSALHIELGNTYRAIAQRHRSLQASSVGNEQETFSDKAAAASAAALDAYQQAIAIAPEDLQRVQAQLNLLSLYLLPNVSGGDSLATLVASLQTNLDPLPTDHRPSLQARLTFAHYAIQLRQVNSPAAPSGRAIATLLRATIAQAQALGDNRLQGMAEATLGHFYEVLYQQTGQQHHGRDALTVTERALGKLWQTDLPEVTYRLYWQQGRILKQQGEIGRAIAAYESAVGLIQSLRRDLVILNPDVQFSFREDIEPVYRELADLLLKDEQPSQDHLKKARQTIDFLQTLEVENYLRQSCNTDTLEAVDKVVDELDPHAAFLYTIILSDRLEIILKLPNSSSLINQKFYISKSELESQAKLIRMNLEGKLPSNQVNAKVMTQELYSQTLAPLETALELSETQTLIFVLDGDLRQIPLGAFWQGENYLIEQYAIAVIPSLQLLGSDLSENNDWSSLIVGADLARPELNISRKLEYISQEIEAVKNESKSFSILYNEDFTPEALENKIRQSNFPVVHIATHGKFYSEIDPSFILAGNGEKIGIKQLADILNSRSENISESIDLLFLSACETAVDNERAILGMAGVSIQAKARSVIASLWYADDEFSSKLVESFYRNLNNRPDLNKAQALQEAQIELLRSPTSSNAQRPTHWAAYLTIGSWL